ncbi:MAG: toll/interleukin-1 receptor domain-containing protein [Clostridiales bacterium]|nr:toll/interleukin-1 receptor domain-containing protein [Clostridiales bacterium]
MALFKCKMCGGTIEFETGATIGVCDSCGTKQTLPRLDDDRKANLYDRANHLRRNNEYDKAMNIYEQILNEDPTDAEAYWSLLLCKYGIEYVEDPATHKRVPTVNRAQFTSIFADENYKSAIEYADGYQKDIYEEEAKTIDEIQKGILEISSKEEPFDVFICYKETDANGRRTPDSVLATELYNELTRDGFKVFFSRITLEDKLGQEYEPYIFAALNSAKVMVVVGTKAEHLNAVWVKNEWSRFLGLIKNGERKILIPAYKDMDPYDLPEEFSHLQAQDMSRLGFMQDLLHGIKKMVSPKDVKPVVKETIVNTAVPANVEPLLKRVFIFLEDGDWNSADEYCERVLDTDPENGRAYLGKLMAELHVNNPDNLKDVKDSFASNNNCIKACRYDKELNEKLNADIQFIVQRNKEEQLNSLYDQACTAMNKAGSEKAFLTIASLFDRISEYKDSKTLADKCRELAEICRKDCIYDIAKHVMERNNIESFEYAIKRFNSISGWKDSDEQASICQRKIEEIKKAEEEARLEAQRKAEQQRIQAEKAAKKRKAVIAVTVPVVCACIVFAILLVTVIIPGNKYKSAITLYEKGKYEEALSHFESLEEYKDSAEWVKTCKDAILDRDYNNAMSLFEKGQYAEAYKCLISLNGYKDSEYKAETIASEHAGDILKSANVGDCVLFGSYEQDNDNSNGKERIDWLVIAKEDNRLLLISKYALDCQRYNKEYTNVTWKTCSLRKWLNNPFINDAFTPKEKKMIKTTKVTADKNPSFDTDPGADTYDKVFVLSINEANQYFKSSEERACKPTEYAVAQGAYKNDSNGNCWWWLRSPGLNSSIAASVYFDGGVHTLGSSVDFSDYAVRPAMWISIKS